MKTVRKKWNRLGITGKFSLAFALMLAFMMLIAATGYISLLFINKAEQQIRKSTAIKQLVLEMDHGLEKSRRLHGNFFLQYQYIGLQAAHEEYAQPSIREIAKVITLSSKLKKLLFPANSSNLAGIHPADINLYLSSAERFAKTSIDAVTLISKRAAPGRGLEAQLRIASLSLEKELQPFPHLWSKYLQARSSYKDYLLSRQRFLMQSTLNDFNEIRSTLELKYPVANEKKAAIITQIDTFEELATTLLDVDLAISGKLRDFNLQEQTVSPLSKKLIQVTQQQAELAEQQIDHIHKITGLIMLIIALFAVYVVLSVAILMHNSVTKNVLRLTTVAREFSNDNLDAQALITSEDELGQLADIFNKMATRLKDLIENLENKVAQRTAELSASEQRFRHLVNDLPKISVQGFDSERRVIYWNNASETIYGYSFEEAFGRRCEELIIPDQMKEEYLVAVRNWLAADITPPASELTLRDKNGNDVPVYSSHIMTTGFQGEKIMYCVDIDLTDLKLAEQQKHAMELRLQRAQKMEAIGLLAGNVAHDLNNILSAIVGYPELLLLDLPADSELRRPLEATKEAGERATAVVADLLTVARGIACSKQPKDLNDLVREYLDSPEFRQLQSLHPHVQVKQQLAASLPAILCSPVHVKKCIMNLAMNGAEAIESWGTITLCTRTHTPEQEWANEHGLEVLEYAVLSIIDTGAGISNTDIEHIFEPFYTKKVMGNLSGTGLGLSVVWNAMQDHQGTVIVSRSNSTTTFALYFPATDAVIPTTNKQVRDMALQGTGETILVVDDEQQLRNLAERMLTMLGYRVSCENSGENALVHLQNQQVDLVVIDMIMDPGMNGRQTYEQMIQINHGQKAIIASGFSESDEVKTALALGAGGFLQKPYSIDQLGRLIKEVLQA